MLRVELESWSSQLVTDSIVSLHVLIQLCIHYMYACSRPFTVLGLHMNTPQYNITQYEELMTKGEQGFYIGGGGGGGGGGM